MAKVNLSPETVREMLSIIREARNDMKKLYDTASMVSSALSKPQEMNLKKKTENPLSQDGDESVSLKQISTVGKVVDGRNHQLLARNASVGREMSRNFEDPLSNFVEHMVGQKHHEVSMVENSKMERYSDGFGRQAPLSTSSVTSPLPKKPPDPPDTIHRKSRNKGTTPPKYSCEEMYERMEIGLCVFCEEFDTPGHCQLKHKGSQILVMECDDEEKVEGLEDSVSVALDQKEKQAIDQEYEHAKAKLEDCPIPNEYQDDPVTLIKSSNDIKLSFSHGSSDFNISILSSVEMVQCISGRDGNEEKHCVCLSQVERIWEPGGLPAKAIQFYWPGIRQQLYQPEICQSLWFSAVVTDTRLKRQLHIQLKELLFGSSEFSAKIHKPPDQNKKCEAELEIQMHHSSKTQKLCVMYHCSKMEFSGFKKLHELSLQKKLGLVSPLVKETQDWIVNAWFKTQACSGFDLASWSGFETYGWKCKKQMIILIDQGQVWEPGGVVTEHDQWKELEKGYACGRLTSLVQEKCSKSWRFKFKDKSVSHEFRGCDIKEDYREYTIWFTKDGLQDYAGFTNDVGLETVLRRGAPYQIPWEDFNGKSLQDYMVPMALEQVTNRATDVVHHMAIPRLWLWHRWKNKDEIIVIMLVGNVSAKEQTIIGEIDILGRFIREMSSGSLKKNQRCMWGDLIWTEAFFIGFMVIQIMVLRQWESFILMLIVTSRSSAFWSDRHILVPEKNMTETLATFVKECSSVCRILQTCLYGYAMQILSSSDRFWLRHKAVFQPLAYNTGLPHYFMEIDNNKRLGVEATLDEKEGSVLQHCCSQHLYPVEGGSSRPTSRELQVSRFPSLGTKMI